MDIGQLKIAEFQRDKKTAHKKQISSEKRKEPPKPRKRAVDNRWTGRGKQHFSHPWHMTTFKGHTGEVLDLDFSSNGKYLATCSDDDPGGTSTEDSSCSSEGNKENTTSTSSTDSSPRKGLSRRQKKNRRSADSSPTQKVEKPKLKLEKTNKPKKMPMLREYEKFRISEEHFYALLHEDTLMPEQMFTLGFPDEFQDKVRILKHSFCATNSIKYYKNNNKECYTDCDEASNSSSDSLDDNDKYSGYNAMSSDAVERTCTRCGTGFFITASEYLTQERCHYHWGKVRYQQENGHYQQLYTCCKNPPGSTGCATGRLHVWNGLNVGINDELEGFVRTKPRKLKQGSYGVYALDCEMCFTVKGLELCKVTVVGMDGKLVYEHFVLPGCEVVDYNTRFSGVTENDMARKQVKTLREVQSDLLKFINDKTIIIGHSLENDLRALKLLHSRIVDTSLSFPHDRGFPFRHSLKYLCSMYLRRDIQSGNVGHDSYEDAASCMELMLWKIRSNFWTRP